MDAKLRGLVDAAGGASRLVRLEAQGSGLRSIQGIEALSRLRLVRLNHNAIEDLSPLERLPALTEIRAHANPAKEPPRPWLFPELKAFSFGLAPDKKSLADLAPLAELRDLAELRIDNARIADLAPLVRLERLSDVSLTANAIEDVRPLARLRRLARVALSENPIEDLSPLLELPKLTTLVLRGTRVRPQQVAALRARGVEVVVDERARKARARKAPDDAELLFLEELLAGRRKRSAPCAPAMWRSLRAGGYVEGTSTAPLLSKKGRDAIDAARREG